MVDVVTFVNDHARADFLGNDKALLFSGWDTASETQYRELIRYVSEGGTLFLAIPHLSTNLTRNYNHYGVEELVRGGDFSELCGMRVRGRGKRFYWASAPDRSGELGFQFPRRFGMMQVCLGDIEITDSGAEVLVVEDSPGLMGFIYRQITEVVAARASTEEMFRITAEVFVDCTGDGGLGVAAGAEYVRGREAHSHLGEVSAAEKADGKTLGSSLLFMARKHDKPMRYVPPPWARKFTEEDFVERPCVGPENDPGSEYGSWWLSWGGHLDAIRDNETIRHELLAILLGIWDFIKNGGDHGAENWALDWFGAVPGKRDSRRFVGQYILTEPNLMESREFADAISYGGWSMELQPPEGFDTKGLQPCRHRIVPFLYDIPMRSCVSRNLSNLMFAGRNMSASHVAFSSTRVMSTCAVTGEGVGLAAALAVRTKTPPGELAADAGLMTELRQRLVHQDAYVIGVVDSQNGAVIRASSEQEGGEAANVISGQNRCVIHPRGIPESRALPGTHRWMSRELPAWIEFEWPENQEIRRIELVFDSGLHRRLTLTQSESIAADLIWGGGQPEMGKTFSVESRNESGQWEPLVRVSPFWQRRWAHSLSATVSTSALRLTAHEIWGCDHARVVTVRFLS